MSNGIVQFSMCLARAFSPTIMSSIFALSVDYNLLGGYAWVVAMFLMGLLGVAQSTSVIRIGHQHR
ncbi:hypothetical protein HWV62_12951 [Athelia sp. TMB]|nr:hypothetical protein HWV62_21751 [Athelia sp. TMB]KAF7984677.1 hypothetical protein HWV62_12951 [Athelia sp. TMB]